MFQAQKQDADGNLSCSPEPDSSAALPIGLDHCPHIFWIFEQHADL
jgi:hypothetical protein